MAQEDEEVEITKGGRGFHNKTVDGRNDASRPGLLQTGKANDFGLRNEKSVLADALEGKRARSAGGPSPCISLHRQSSFRRRLRQASVGQPIARRTSMFDVDRRLNRTAEA